VCHSDDRRTINTFYAQYEVLIVKPYTGKAKFNFEGAAVLYGYITVCSLSHRSLFRESAIA
jgi:hypothetical protein